MLKTDVVVSTPGVQLPGMIKVLTWYRATVAGFNSQSLLWLKSEKADVPVCTVHCIRAYTEHPSREGHVGYKAK